MRRKKFKKNTSSKQKHKITSQRKRIEKIGQTTIKYNDKTSSTQGIDFMKRGSGSVVDMEPESIAKSIDPWMPKEDFKWWNGLNDIKIAEIAIDML